MDEPGSSGGTEEAKELRRFRWKLLRIGRGKLFNLSRSDTVSFEADSTDQGSAPESPFPQTLSDHRYPRGNQSDEFRL